MDKGCPSRQRKAENTDTNPAASQYVQRDSPLLKVLPNCPALPAVHLRHDFFIFLFRQAVEKAEYNNG